MNKSKRRVSKRVNKKSWIKIGIKSTKRSTALLSVSTPKPFRKYRRIQDEEEECDESAESLLLEENVKKLLAIDVERPRRRNIFTGAQEPHQRIRRSIITRALRNVISSTPMPTRVNGNFFSTECSLNISPINSENDEVENTISAEPNQPQNVDPNVISVSSDSSDTKYKSSDNAKNKELLSELKTHYTRSQRRHLGDKISPNLTKSDKELHSIGDECKSREANVNGINQTHIGLPELSVTLTTDTGLNAKDKVATNMSNIDPAETSDRIALKSAEKSYKINKNLSRSPHRTKADDGTSDRIEANKTTKNVSKSLCRTKSDERTSNIIELKSSEKANKVSKNASKSPFQADDEIAIDSKLKSAEKSYKISKNLSVSPNRNKTIEKSYQINVVDSESHFPDGESSDIGSNSKQSSKSRKNNSNVPDIQISSRTSKNSVNSVFLSPIQESQDFRTPTRPDNCIRTASARFSSRNVTLRKRSQIDSREQSTAEEQNTAGNKDQSEVVIKRLKNLEERSSKIPVLRTRSKSREKPDELESQARNTSPGESIQSNNNSNKENKDALPLAPPKPAPRGRKKKKSALVKSSEKNHSIQKIVSERVKTPLNLQSAFSGLLGGKTTDEFQKRFVDIGTSPNISPRAICDPAATHSIAISTDEQIAESNVFSEKKQSLMGSLNRKTFSVPKKVVATAVSPLVFFNSSSSIEKEERARRLDNIISKMTEQQSPLVNSKVQTLERSSKPPSNLDLETQHKQVQTSLRKIGKTNKKIGLGKKNCARNIFTKTVAETQTSNIDHDDTSLSSGMTDSSKILEEFDGGNLFNSLEKGPVFHESFSSSNSFDDSEVMHREAPWRFEDQVVSQSSKRISVKLNFLRSAIQIEEEKTLLSKKRLENDSDSSSRMFEDSGGKIDYIDKNRQKQLPRFRSTFRDYTYKSTKKKTAEGSRTSAEKNIDSSSELDTDHSVCDRNIEGVFIHPRRMSLEKKPQEEDTEKDIEQPEENTLIDIDSGLQRSEIHETNISHVEKGNSEDNLVTSQTSKHATPSKFRSNKGDPIIPKRKSDVETQKHHEVPSEFPTDSAEKENGIHRIIQETTNSPHLQKSIIDLYLENQLGSGLSDSENEKDQEKEQSNHGSSRSRNNHSRNMSNLVNGTENIAETNHSKKKISTHSSIGNDTRSQEDKSETAVYQMQNETATKRKKGSKTSLSAKTKFISSSTSKNQSKYENDTQKDGNNEETDPRERNAEHSTPAQFGLNTDNCEIESLKVLPADENLETDATVSGLSHTQKQRKLSVMLSKLSEKSIHRKWSRINKILDSEDEDDPELHSRQNTPKNRNKFESFNDLAVPLNRTSIMTTPKLTRKASDTEDVVSNETEESRKSTENPQSENKKEEEPLFKIPKIKSRKVTRKRNFPSSGDDISVASEDSSLTGTRRSARDRRPPKRRFVMEHIVNPVKVTNKSRTKPVKKNRVESDEEEEYTHKRDTSRKKDQQKTETTGKRGRQKKVIPLAENNLDKDEDNLTEVLETTNKRHTNQTAASNSIEDKDNSTKGPETTSKRHTTNRMVPSNSTEEKDDSTKGPETTGKRPRRNKKSTLNSLKDDDSTNQPRTTSKRTRTNKKTALNSLDNEDKLSTSIDKETTSVPTEENLDQTHGITAVNNDNGTPRHSQDAPNHFEMGEERQDLDDEMFLRIPNPQNMTSQDSGTSTLLKSNTFDVSNLQSTKRPRKVNKPNKRISKVVSETVSKSPRNEVNIPEEKNRRMKRNSLVENEYVDICSGSEIIRLKYVENDVEFLKCQDNLSLTNFIRGVNGATMGYLKLPVKGMKPIHTAKKHALCYFVLEGEGKIQVHNRTSRVGKLSHFIIPLGVEYAIMNDGPQDMLLACVRVEGTCDT